MRQHLVELGAGRGESFQSVCVAEDILHIVRSKAKETLETKPYDERPRQRNTTKPITTNSET